MIKFYAFLKKIFGLEFMAYCYVKYLYFPNLLCLLLTLSNFSLVNFYFTGRLGKEYLKHADAKYLIMKLLGYIQLAKTTCF